MPGAIIVGAGALIGASLARRFARAGMPVAVVARRRETVEATVSTVRDDGGTALGLVADVADEPAIRSALDVAVSRHGIPDVLVYNAAVIRPDSLGRLSASDLLDTLAVNVVGAVIAAAHLGPRMAAAGGGTIIVTGGMPETVPSYFSLSLGKAGVRAVVSLLAQELGPTGVHVATVTVGDVVERGTAYDPDDIAEVYVQLHQQAPDAWKQEMLFVR